MFAVPPFTVAAFGVVVSMKTVSPAVGARFVLQFPLTNQSPEAAPVQPGVPASAGETQPAMTAPASSAATLVEQDNNRRRRNFTDVFSMIISFQNSS
jgi:hypothetical protein